MSLPVPVVWSEDCLRHEPGGEVWLGLREPGTEVPARALVLRDALAAAGAPVTAAREHDDTIVRRVHDPGLLGHLATVWADWEAAGLPAVRVLRRVHDPRCSITWPRSGRTGSRRLPASTAGTGWCPTCSPPRACWPGCRPGSRRPCTPGPGCTATTR